jgi:hypothetical protein
MVLGISIPCPDINLCMFLSSSGVDYKNYCLMVCDAIKYGTKIATFQRNKLPSFS